MAEQYWRPIDTAPKSAIVPLLLWFPWGDTDNPALGGAHGAIYIGVWSYDSEGDVCCWRDESDFEALGDPTLWMPLPEPPAERDDA